ncbi:DUF3846 domain-containing protein, partial [Microbacterium sp. UBA7513]
TTQTDAAAVAEVECVRSTPSGQLPKRHHPSASLLPRDLSENYRVLGRDNSKEVGRMVRSIVIPHDPARSPRLRHLATAGEFQDVVDGWLGLVEMPALGVTVYVNEAARRDRAPINCRAMALWWLYTADPMQGPIILGDVILTGNGELDATGDVPEVLVQDIFEARRFIIEGRRHGEDAWRDTYARFDSIFDAATWCLVLSNTLRAALELRLTSRAVKAATCFDDPFRESDALW